MLSGNKIEKEDACVLRLSTCSQQVEEKLQDGAIMVTVIKPTVAIMATWSFSDEER